MTRPSQKAEERYAVEALLDALEFRQHRSTLVELEGAHDFEFELNAERVRIEATRYVTRVNPTVDTTARDDAEFEAVRRECERAADADPRLDRVDLYLALRRDMLGGASAFLPGKASRAALVDELRRFAIEHAESADPEPREVQARRDQYPTLASLVRHVEVRRAIVCFALDWSKAGGSIGTNDEELCAVLRPKCERRTPRKPGAAGRAEPTEWLLVYSTPARPHQFGIASPDKFDRLSNSNRLLERSPYQRVHLHDHITATVAEWQRGRDPRWRQVGVRHPGRVSPDRASPRDSEFK